MFDGSQLAGGQSEQARALQAEKEWRENLQEVDGADGIVYLDGNGQVVDVDDDSWA